MVSVSVIIPTYQPRITVLMSAYNAEKYLSEAVENILGQTFTEFEFILVGDGSSDGTAKNLSNYTDKWLV